MGVLALAAAGVFAAFVVGYSGWRANVSINNETLNVRRWTTIRLAELRDARLVHGGELRRARRSVGMLGGNIAPHYVRHGYVLTFEREGKSRSEVVGTRRPEAFARALIEAEDTPEPVRAMLRRANDVA